MNWECRSNSKSILPILINSMQPFDRRASRSSAPNSPVGKIRLVPRSSC